jgi:hypothetical protein
MTPSREFSTRPDTLCGKYEKWPFGHVARQMQQDGATKPKRNMYLLEIGEAQAPGSFGWAKQTASLEMKCKR